MKNKISFLLISIFLLGCSVSNENHGGGPSKLELLKLHNQERFDRGYGDLQPHPRLEEAAQKHADWMAKNKKMSHTGEGRSSVGDRVGDGWRTWGENVAYGQRTVTEVHRVWMNSSGHRANILNKNFKDVGIGVAIADNGNIYWCVNFGLEN